MADILTPISTACSKVGKWKVLCGVVIDTMGIRKSGGTSLSITFTIRDDDFDKSWRDPGSLKVRIFHDNETCLPDVRLDDVVLIRNMRTKDVRGELMGSVTSFENAPWIIFRPEPGPGSSPFVISGPVPFKPSLWEENQAQSLLDRRGSAGSKNVVQQSASRYESDAGQIIQVQASRGAPTTPAAPKGWGGLPYCLVKDLVANSFCQLLGQVVKMKTYDSEKCLLYMTDFTENENLAEYKKPGEDDEGVDGDEYNYMKRKYNNDWPGPWGKHVIEAVLWEPHAKFARESLKTGDIVLLTYVRPKEARYLEVAVHEDRKFPDKIHVRICNNHNDEHVQGLMNRRAEYWKIHGEPKKDAKKDAKKTSKQAKKAQAQKKEVQKEEGQLTLPTSTRTKKNANVKTRTYTTAISPLEKIILAESHTNHGPGGVVYQLPFQNIHYRSTARVIDFFPPNLEDFAVQTVCAPLYTSQDSATEPSIEWQWRFCLLVEGIGPKQPNQQHREPVKLYVVGQDGDCLFNEEAADLRSHPRRLSRMREKLFLLWGNLEEQKMKAMASGSQTWGPVSSVPFECCIKEYGVPCTHSKDSNAMDIDDEACVQTGCFGWERRFALFGTTIHEA
ncbi:hypothetical protein MYU51_003575 [Penicillium brevicompactum]